HKLCGTGSGTEMDVTASTNCRSGAPTPTPTVKSGAQLGLGIGSEDVKADTATKATAKALTAQQYDTLVKAFEANDASTAGTGDGTGTCDSSGNKACGSAVKAGNAFDGTLSSSKIKTDVAGMCQQSRI
ncbi:MAG: hypothetical protein ACTJLK_03875, partial [Anaplasma sp.]